MKYIVYCTTNIKNNKIYIGVHKTEDSDVFDGYIGNGISRKHMGAINNPTTPFQYAVKKYGYDSFKRVTLKEFDNLEDALDLERWLVDLEFIKRKDTYNCTLGGGIPPLLNKVVFQYDLNGVFLKQWESIVSAAKFYNISETAIGRAVLYKSTSANYLWSDVKVEQLNIEDYTIYNPEQTVYLYSERGDFVIDFESQSQCSKYLNCPISNIQRSLSNGTITKGYYISYKKADKYEKLPPKKLSGDFHMYDLEGNYIRSFESKADAEYALKISLVYLNDTLKIGRNYYKGYLWHRGDKLDRMDPYKPKNKKIGQYTSDGTLVKVFDTLRECRKEFPNVSKVLKGTANHCHGYKFKYIE